MESHPEQHKESRHRVTPSNHSTHTTRGCVRSPAHSQRNHMHACKQRYPRVRPNSAPCTTAEYPSQHRRRCRHVTLCIRNTPCRHLLAARATSVKSVRSRPRHTAAPSAVCSPARCSYDMQKSLRVLMLRVTMPTQQHAPADTSKYPRIMPCYLMQSF
jgi:hypothetical protein